MKCPYCGHDSSAVLDSREAREGIEVRRRRRCEACAQRFTTYERCDLALPKVIKRDGRREEFKPEKILSGVLKALEKRPVRTGTAQKLVDDLMAEVLKTGKQELASTWIGEAVMDRLKGLDPVAYLRFASVYRRFQDLVDFLEELKTLSTADPLPKAGALPKEAPWDTVAKPVSLPQAFSTKEI